MAYFGEYGYTLDAANRIIVPPRFREQLGAEVVIYKAILPDLALSCLRRLRQAQGHRRIHPLRPARRHDRHT